MSKPTRYILVCTFGVLSLLLLGFFIWHYPTIVTVIVAAVLMLWRIVGALNTDAEEEEED